MRRLLKLRIILNSWLAKGAFVQADHRRYIRYHKRIIETVDKHLPIKKVMSIDEMACELIGRECSEDFIRHKAADIKNAIAHDISPALTCSVGAAPNRYLVSVRQDRNHQQHYTFRSDAMFNLHRRN